MARASRAKRSVNWAFETLIATSLIQPGIMRAVDLSHATLPGESKDLIGAEFIARGERHMNDESR